MNGGVSKGICWVAQQAQKPPEMEGGIEKAARTERKKRRVRLPLQLQQSHNVGSGINWQIKALQTTTRVELRRKFRNSGSLFA
jgi:hypothetical protein